MPPRFIAAWRRSALAALAAVVMLCSWSLHQRRMSIAASGDIAGTLQFGGLQRSYLVHLPAHYTPTRAWPLLLVLHGRGGTASGMVGLTLMDEVADRYGFIAAYPDGYRRGWADGRGASPSDRAGVDDVGFIMALLDHLSASYSIDRHAIGATGISNGGFMVQRLACDHAERFAAIAAVAATMPTGLSASCRPSRPIPVLYMHGTADPLVPYTGGTVKGDRGRVLSSDDSARRWAYLDRCTGRQTDVALPNRAADGTSIRLTSFSGCAGAGTVVRYAIEGGGHTWPGGRQYLPVGIVGRTSHDLDASVVIWQFLRDHSPAR